MDPAQIIIGLLVIILILLLSLVILLIVSLRRRREASATEALTDLMTKQLDIFGGVQQKLGELSSVGQQVDRLSTMLQRTQQRGVWGEQLLEVLLDHLLPNYHGHHTFSDGQMVEQALLLPGGQIVAVDSKFTLDPFHRLENASSDQERKRAKAELTRSLRERIDETAKYIRPAEGTLDFALMFLPAESVYYQLISDDDLCIRAGSGRERKPVWSYALERHVVPVSPNTLYAYLTVIVYGLRGLQIEQKTKEILDHLLQLQVEFGKLQKEWAILGTHLTNARSKYDGLDKLLSEFGDRLRVETIVGLEDSLPVDAAELAARPEQE